MEAWSSACRALTRASNAAISVGCVGCVECIGTTSSRFSGLTASLAPSASWMMSRPSVRSVDSTTPCFPLCMGAFVSPNNLTAVPMYLSAQQSAVLASCCACSAILLNWASCAASYLSSIAWTAARCAIAEASSMLDISVACSALSSASTVATLSSSLAAVTGGGDGDGVEAAFGAFVDWFDIRGELTSDDGTESSDADSVLTPTPTTLDSGSSSASSTSAAFK
mmetsp:Transcript_5488/g.12086  ORF Transcript_5488/g.12086 Transcript_5488/m.12086 type:complete len:224 (+) Transcript_5488:359-1030(+)